MITQTVNGQRKAILPLPFGKGTMTHLLIITEDTGKAAPLRASLNRNGFACASVSYEDALTVLSRQPPNLVIIEISGRDDALAWRLIARLKKSKSLPVMALVAEQSLASLESHHEIDDFIISPYVEVELVLRISRLLHKTRNADSGELIKCNGLTIDPVTCEVTVDGAKVELTFKEYELLKLMASHKGRVFTREALLDGIWGYDYYGGDRTVDVHIRRLRSKIEDANHTYIETVRNIGYRFIKNP
jgi:DNA-binding response OmpR family regulator